MKTLKCNTTNLSKLAGLSAIAIIAAGCGGKTDEGGEAGNTATGKSVDQNFRDTAGAASNTADNVVGAAGNVVAAGGNQVSGAANTVAGAGNVVVKGAKDAGSAMVNTPDIKTAIGASKMMAGSKIDVDSNATSVTLKGTVKSVAQKSMASSIAKGKAGGLKIVNNLTIKK